MFNGNPTWGNLAPSGRCPYADTFDEALTGFNRRRKNVTFVMPNTGEAGARSCVICQARLDAPALPVVLASGRTLSHGAKEGNAGIDKFSTWTYRASSKEVGNGMHSVCSWAATMLQIFEPRGAV